ncbi:MAG: hypothetical protein JSW71_17685 [Gemmatimonadota bacterium]|nr:MAG: hypothetical protein JSW71_17685 [Gemmatimonadota bacterium]
MIRVHQSPGIPIASCALLAVSICAFTACGDATGPDLTASPYLFRAVATGGSLTCGLQGDSTLLCWGGTLLRIPTRIYGAPRRFAAISGSGHFCGLTADGAAYCWGYNGEGQLGDGTTESSITRVTGDRVEITFKAVAGAHRFTTISVGDQHTCGITVDGAAYCWGGNFEGQLGDGTTENRLVPTAVSGAHTFMTVDAGSAHTCALASDGTAYCWGENRQGELGDGTTTARPVPTLVAGDARFTSVSASQVVSCGITRDARAYCWGAGVYLGAEPTDECDWSGSTFPCSKTPTPIAGDLTAKDLAAGYGHMCSVAEDGTAYCWGYNHYGQLGDGTIEDRDSPTPVAGSIRFATLSAGGSHTCGVTPEGVLYCWGDNRRGQLGDGSGAPMWTTPVVVWGW